jgi:hypothetical protein
MAFEEMYQFSRIIEFNFLLSLCTKIKVSIIRVFWYVTKYLVTKLAWPLSSKHRGPTQRIHTARTRLFGQVTKQRGVGVGFNIP